MMTEAALAQLVRDFGPGIKITATPVGGRGASQTLAMIRRDFEARGAFIFDGPGEHEIVLFGRPALLLPASIKQDI